MNRDTVAQNVAPHTPGPWTIQIDRVATEHSPARWFIRAGRWIIAETKVLGPSLSAPAKANAHLIAAAPDLLAAVKLALAVERSVTQGQERKLRAGYLNVLTTAIAKAEGRDV